MKEQQVYLVLGKNLKGVEYFKMEAYCMKCRKKQKVKNEQQVKVKGRNAIKGICSICGTKMFKFI